jgi:hypothetical protein
MTSSKHSRTILGPLLIHDHPTFKTGTFLESGRADSHLAPLSNGNDLVVKSELLQEGTC